MCVYLRNLGLEINRKRIQHLYHLLSIEALYPKPKTTVRHIQHKVYPYLLRNITINNCNQVWSTDITYIRLHSGFVYLMAVMDWFSRYVLTWRLNTGLETDFCIDALRETLSRSRCEIFNTDQGVQFTCDEWINTLKSHQVQISMDGRGRALDNIFVERLWRSVKYECIYLRELDKVRDVQNALEDYFHYYNHERPHQSLDYKTPASIYLQ